MYCGAVLNCIGGRCAPLNREGATARAASLTTVRRGLRRGCSTGASADGAGFPGFVSSGIHSPPLLSIQSGQGESNAHRKVYDLKCCPYTMPRPASEPQNTESVRSQYTGKPATGRFGFLRVAMRVMSWNRGLRVYLNVLTSALASHERTARSTRDKVPQLR